MSNNIDWGLIYCSSWFGDEDNLISILNDAAPGCLFAADYLLDTYPALLGYSLRKLSSNASYGIRVRRDSDNAETDVTLPATGIINGNSIVSAGGTLSSWKGSANLFIVTLYNQGTGGVNYDLTQSTTTKQPQFGDVSTIYDYIDFNIGNVILKGAVPISTTEGSLFSLWDTTSASVRVSTLSNAVETNSGLYSIEHWNSLGANNFSCRIVGVGVLPTFVLAGNTNLNNSKKVVSVTSDGTRTLHSIDGDPSSSLSVVAGSDTGQWFGDNVVAGQVIQMGGVERSGAFYGGGEFFETILTATEVNETTIQIINTDIKTNYGV